MLFRCRLLFLKVIVLFGSLSVVFIYFYSKQSGDRGRNEIHSGGSGHAGNEEEENGHARMTSKEDAKNEEIEDEQYYQDDGDWSDGVNVVLTFSKAAGNGGMEKKLRVCISSMFDFSSVPILIHLIGDEISQRIAKEIVHSETERTGARVKVYFHNVETISSKFKDTVSAMQPYFSYKPGAYYSDVLFFLSLAIHKVFQQDKILMLDIDLKFREDIRDLWEIFAQFNHSDAIIGIAREQQPVYRHAFHAYRKENPLTSVGEPPPHGQTGFNSAVLLMDLNKMRQSDLYNSLLNASAIEALVEKFKFRGHLGGQDFFTLIGLEHPQLFHLIPCFWNKQLCQWWKHHGYEDVFEQYYECKEPINIYHGNCNTNMPVEDQ